MPVPHPSFLYGESTEPPKTPLPLEARSVHFCWSYRLCSIRSSTAHLHEDVGRWNVSDPGGTLIPTDYAFRHDMIKGGHRARTAAEAEIEWYVQIMVLKEGKLDGWWPRIENFRGHGHCFDVIFLRPNMFGCTNDVEVAAGSPELKVARWESEPQMGRWDPLPEPELVRWELQQHGDEAPEPVPALEESLENDESSTGDTTSDDDSDYVPPTAHTEREARSQRAARSRARIETRALMRQMRRTDEAQMQIRERG